MINQLNKVFRLLRELKTSGMFELNGNEPDFN